MLCNNLKQDKKKLKVNLSHYCHADTKGEMRYSSYSFLTSALEGWVSGLRRALAALFSVKLRLSGVTHVVSWELPNVLANIAVAILRVNMIWLVDLGLILK
jgi:hypothetical protein